MFKNILCILLFCFSANAIADPNFWIEGKAISNKGEAAAQVLGGISGGITENIGYFALVQVADRYTQVYAGPTFKPASWLEIGVGVGAEEFGQKSTLRKAGYLFAGDAALSVLAAYENGGSGPWHKIVLNYAVTEKIGVGIMQDKFLGLGPRAEYRVNKTLTLSGALLQEEGRLSTVLSMHLKF